VLYTDGIIEAVARQGRERFGTERLIAVVEANRDATPVAIRDRLMDAVTDFAAALDDDVTLLCARYLGDLS
jgi:serine phosphatase RsbU (regulator of sigma subunit)